MGVKSLLDQRAVEAREKSRFYSGATDKHPQGLSGRKFLLPRELTTNCWDVPIKSCWHFSECAFGQINPEV